MNPKQQMLRSSVVVAFFNLLGGLSGILVETSIAANLGLSVRSDTFYVAYTIPYIITNLLTATGQFSLVPFFASLESTQDEKELWRGFSYVANILFLGLGHRAGGHGGFPWIIHGIAPGFTHQEVADRDATFALALPDYHSRRAGRSVAVLSSQPALFCALDSVRIHSQRRFHCRHRFGFSPLRGLQHLHRVYGRISAPVADSGRSSFDGLFPCAIL